MLASCFTSLPAVTKAVTVTKTPAVALFSSCTSFKCLFLIALQHQLETHTSSQHLFVVHEKKIPR